MTAITTRHGVLVRSDRTDARRLVLTTPGPASVTEALSATTDFYGSRDFEVWIDDRSLAARVTPELTAAGWEAVQDTVVLALVGPLRAAAGPEDLAFDDVVDLDGLRTWETVRLQAFADTEEPPPATEVDAALSVRQAEWPVCRYQLARLDGRAVGILGHYTGRDQMVFLLGTRPTARHRGIAQAMLRHWVHGAEGANVRSLLINCDDGGPAAALYHRVGFTDEVYWHRRCVAAPYTDSSARLDASS